MRCVTIKHTGIFPQYILVFATMILVHSKETLLFNSQLRIINLKGYKFNTPKGICEFNSGFGLAIMGKGFVKFKSEKSPIPYNPIGGKKALQSIIDAGGFVHYNDIEFIMPLN